MQNKVLVVAVHADDETLGCGGALLKHKKSDDEVYWLLLTTPTNNQNSGYSDEFILQRKELLNTISERYGFNNTYTLDFPTQLLHTIDLREIIQAISGIINQVKPNIIYTMFNNDVHSDHRVAFEALYSCTKNFRYPFIERILMMETLSETEFAPALQSTSFIPNVFIEISDSFKEKIEIMKMYNTELMESPYPRSLDTIEALSKYRGSRIGVKYAEAFMLLFEKMNM